MATWAAMKVDVKALRLTNILERLLETRQNDLFAVGTSSSLPLSLLFTQCHSKTINSLPHLVVVPSHSAALRFCQDLEFFDPMTKAHVLPHFDVSPYSTLYPKTQIVGERLRFLYRAQNAKPGEIFVSSIGSLLQKTLPFSDLAQKSRVLRKDSELEDQFSSYLQSLGYISTPFVEDYGQYSVRGGIFDIFSPAHDKPVRIELFGDVIESMRFFNPDDQRSLEETTSFIVIPPREIIYSDETLEDLVAQFRKDLEGREVPKEESDEMLRALVQQQVFPGSEFLLSYFYKTLSQPLEHFSSPLNVWLVDPMEVSRQADLLLEEMKSDYVAAENHPIRPLVSSLYLEFDQIAYPDDSKKIHFSKLDLESFGEGEDRKFSYSSQNVQDFIAGLHALPLGSDAWTALVKQKLSTWKDSQQKVYIAARNQGQSERLKVLLEKAGFNPLVSSSEDYSWGTWDFEQSENDKTLHIIPRTLSESLRLNEEESVFLRDEDFLGRKQRVRDNTGAEAFQKEASRLAFGDLKVGDCVVHTKHGIGIYEGLKVMPIQGVDNEFIQISYKDKDKLYVPVYNVSQLQKYSSNAATAILDKLGGQGWEKTKIKVKSQLRDIASELLALYAKRAEAVRPAFSDPGQDFFNFETAFPYDETVDQLKSIESIIKDMTGSRPMDRLICGDVGFGKTEVAMRAAFAAVHDKKQVAVLAPTTVLTFQHVETFKKRFHGWPIVIKGLNRFISNAEAKETLKELKEGKVDIIIGTHRLFSKDVEFKNLGLLIVDEEQKFGVAHKEKIRKLKNTVDTLAMSATPIPRTLNMSLVGIRDLSIINTAPVDRLPTRTFVCKFEPETIRKAIMSEISRGGQIYFIHNRVQSIYGLADEVRQIVPEARIRVAHGQMEEHELEKAMLAFFNHEIDVLICTTIVESGMDIPRANTMFIDNAQMMGLSQLYQLRGRVGRSKQRAYCYLMLPRGKQIDKDAQERLKVIQENTALGSGIRVAQYDLELRGAGNILGEDQSGHINAVGYEMYMDLLGEAIHEARGEPLDEQKIEPEINLRIPAMIPDAYISDIRVRLSYYKALSDVKSPEDLDTIEEELKDQFGPPPEPVMNLLGIMLIRSRCKTLGIRDIGAGVKNVSLIFTEKTPLKPETVIQLAMRENKKYSVTPDNRLNIRMNAITWPQVFEELNYLLKLI